MIIHTLGAGKGMTQEYWNKKFSVKNYYGSMHTPFAEECLVFLKQQNFQGKKLLDLGCGQGQDALFFAKKSYEVTALDYSSEALNSITDKHVTKVHVDMRNLSRFHTNAFNIVYSSFSLHFLTRVELKKIISEIQRILVTNGYFFFNLKSTRDKYYRKGGLVDSDCFRYEGVLRSFYDEETTRSLLDKFTILSFSESSHLNKKYDDKPTVYWKVIARKKA